MKIVSKKSKYVLGDFLAGIDGAYTELCVEEAGHKVYIQGEWCTESEDIDVSITKTSVYDINIKIDPQEDNFDDLIEKRNAAQKETVEDWFPNEDLEVKFASQISEVKNMMEKLLKKNGVEWPIDD